MRYLGNGVYEGEVTRKGGIIIPNGNHVRKRLRRAHLKKTKTNDEIREELGEEEANRCIEEACELYIGPNIMDMYKSIIALHTRPFDGENEHSPIRDLEDYKIEGKEIVIPELRNLLKIRGRKVVMTTGIYSLDFWHPTEWKNLCEGKAPMSIDQRLYDLFTRIA